MVDFQLAGHVFSRPPAVVQGVSVDQPRHSTIACAFVAEVACVCAFLLDAVCIFKLDKDKV